MNNKEFVCQNFYQENIMQKNWNDEEVKQLFSCVKQIKQNNKPLSYAFVLHANKFNRKPNSVKNYYYFELNNIASDTLRAKWLGISAADFVLQQHNNISPCEKTKIIDYIQNNLNKGISIRQSCKTLACQDISLMQKYQNLFHRHKTQTKINNVVSFDKEKQKLSNKLSDKDINLLFLGLVKLIKREAFKEANLQLKKECEFATYNYQKALSLLKQKEHEVDKLLSINKTLNQQVQTLKQNVPTKN